MRTHSTPVRAGTRLSFIRSGQAASVRAAVELVARVGTFAQHAFEVGRVVGLEHARLPREVVVPQPRNPEAQRGGAQHGGEQGALGAGEAGARCRMRRAVRRRARHRGGRSRDRWPSRSGTRRCRTARCRRRRSRSRTRRSDGARRRRRACRTWRCRGTGRHVPGRAAGLRRPRIRRRGSDRRVRCAAAQPAAASQIGQDHWCGVVPPGQTAQVGLDAGIVPRRQVHARQQAAEFCAMGCGRGPVRSGPQALHDRGRLAGDGVQQFARRIGRDGQRMAGRRRDGRVGAGLGHRKAAALPGASSGTGSTEVARRRGARTASARIRPTPWSRSSWCSRCRPRCRCRSVRRTEAETPHAARRLRRIRLP